MGLYISPDDLTVNVPLEFLCPTGRPEDFIGLTHVLPRTPGVLRYSQALERTEIANGQPRTAVVFGDPWH